MEQELEYEFVDFEYNGKYYNLTLSAVADIVDEGIGYYEFWGSSGYHEDLVVLIEDIKCVMVEDEEINQIIPDDDMALAIKAFINMKWEYLASQFEKQLE